MGGFATKFIHSPEELDAGYSSYEPQLCGWLMGCGCSSISGALVNQPSKLKTRSTKKKLVWGVFALALIAIAAITLVNKLINGVI